MKSDEEILEQLWERFNKHPVNTICLTCHSGAWNSVMGDVCPKCTFGKDKKSPPTRENYVSPKDFETRCTRLKERS